MGLHVQFRMQNWLYQNGALRFPVAEYCTARGLRPGFCTNSS
uniref:Uncharacterized protein n=1 Tax=Anguilla anguilla TaxID=7936 RepID=A0A0E9WM41_ANGAN